MNRRSAWAARAAAAVVSATVLVGVGARPATAAPDPCIPIWRPNGAVTQALEPLLGTPWSPGPLGTTPFALTGTLDRVVCWLGLG